MEKVSSWRPEGWDSENIVVNVYEELTIESTDETERKLVEAGADAMLETLRKQPSVKYQFTDRGVPNPGFPISGTYYLIPEGEDIS